MPTLARMDDHKYVEITRPAWEAIYRAICRELPGHPGVQCPVMWGGNATYGSWTETYWGTQDAPLLYSMIAKEGTGQADHFFVIQELIHEDA